MHELSQRERRLSIRYGWISIAAALLTMALKFGAYYLSGSVGLLSDAMESLVNLAAGLFATFSLIIATRPPDKDHPYGHGKIEHLSGGVEGILILVAAVAIAWAAIGRIIHPVELQRLDISLLVSVAAAAVNFFTARIMLRASRHFDSMILEADARHLMTDVFTTGGMILSLSIILFNPKRLYLLDPIVALVLAIYIAFTGFRLVKSAVDTLMDKSLSPEEIAEVHKAIQSHMRQDGKYHALKSRKSGHLRYIEFHLLLRGETPVHEAHDLTCAIEHDINSVLPNAQVIIHIEPLEDGRSYDD